MSNFSAIRAPFGPKGHEELSTPQIKKREDIYQRLLTNLCHNLRVEQGALFSVVNGEILPLARINLSLAQFDGVRFSRYRHWLRKECTSTQITRRSGPEGHAVCIPTKRGGNSFILYLCNMYFRKEMDLIDNSILRTAAESFAKIYSLQNAGIPRRKTF